MRRGGRRRVALAVAAALPVRHGVRGGRSAGDGALHTGGPAGRQGLRPGAGRDGRGAPDGRGRHGRRRATQRGSRRGRSRRCARRVAQGRSARRRARRIGAGRRRGGRAGDGGRRELAAAFRAGALPRWRRLLLGRPALGAAAALLLLSALGAAVLEPDLRREAKAALRETLFSQGGPEGRRRAQTDLPCSAPQSGLRPTLLSLRSLLLRPAFHSTFPFGAEQIWTTQGL